MDSLFTIGEVSKRLNIPASTLRFWEQEGLFSVAKSDNLYRKYTIRDLTVIADIIFFRNLGVPISQMREIRHGSLEHYAEQLRQTQSQLQLRIREDMQMYERTQKQFRHLEEVRHLIRCPFAEEDVPFQAVASFDYLEKEKLLQYAQDPSSYVRYFDTKDMRTEKRGIMVSPDHEVGTLLWKKSSGSRYLTFLIREQVDHDYKSDVEENLQKIRSGHETGYLLAQYMLTATENGERIDYLKAYLEVFPKE